MPVSAQILQRFPNAVYIETGTFRGESLRAALQAGFRRACSIEISPELHAAASRQFAGDPRVRLVCGDSAQLLPGILRGINLPVTFWLDAHGYAGDGTKGSCPLLAELEAIAAHPIEGHTILIDDFGVMGRGFREGVFEHVVREHLAAAAPGHLVMRIDSPRAPWDILAAVPHEPARPIDAGDYVRLIERRVPFVQANYGDGEFYCMLGHDGENSQGGIYYPELGAALRRTLIESRFTWHGFNPGARAYAEVATWLAGEGFNVPILEGLEIRDPDRGLRDPDRGCATHNVRWVHKALLPAANVHGRFGAFIAAVDARRPLLVGPAHLRGKLPIRTCEHIVSPLPNAWNRLDELEGAVLEAIDRHKPDLICVSCGMAANVLLWRIAPRMDPSVTMLDTGALWDPYADVFSRAAYGNPAFLEKRAMSLEVARCLIV